MSDTSPAPDPVCLAVGLGWLLAELYDSKRLPGPPPDDEERPLPPHLPGIGAMTPYEKAYALAAHVGADLARLEAALGLGMPTAKSIQAVLDTPGHARDDVRRAVHDLYLDIRNRLAGTDPAAALAFGLGRMLADTTLLPESAEPQVLAERFERYRIANALAWLDDLDAKAARPLGFGGPRLAAALGELGRGPVRSGRQDRAGDDRHGSHPSPAPAGMCVAEAAVGATVWAALTYTPSGTDRVVAVLVSAAGFLGLSWASVRATLGRAVRQAEHAMWDAEVVAAIGKAATVIPGCDESGPAAAELADAGMASRP
jgi:hypothetical protein